MLRNRLRAPPAAADEAPTSHLNTPNICHILSLSALAIVLCLISESSNTSNSPKFSIYIDAGSTGSRIHVIPYRRTWRRIPVEVDLGLMASKKVTPGLSTFAESPEGAGEQMRELVEFAKERVGREMWEFTEIRLFATAGLRLVEGEIAERILEACRGVLRSSGFRFLDEWAAVISGADEGIYAWVAANYALGTLGADPEKTTGILELGGASAQITFVPNEPLPLEFSHVLKFGESTYNLYSHSFLHLGQNVAYGSLHDLLHSGGVKTSAESLQETTYKDPCTPRGYLHSEESMNLPMVSLKPNARYKYAYAVGNFSECRSATLLLLQNGKENCLYERCQLGSVYIPKLQGKFLATENFFHTSKFFGLGATSSLSGLMIAGERFCNEEWLHLKNTYDLLDEDDLLPYCFSAAYIVALLHDSLGFALDDERLIFANQAGNLPLDWALGAFIMEKSLNLDAENSGWFPIVPGTNQDSWGLRTCFILIILVLFTTWCLLKRRKPQLKTYYDW